jgi:hypothetical protein
MLNFLKKPVVTFVIGLIMFLFGIWMLSPWAVILYGKAILSIGHGEVFLALYLLAVIFGAGGLGLMISSFGEE